MSAPKIIDLEVARQFLSDPKAVVLREATEITDEAAIELARHEGLLWLDGIEKLSKTAAIALGRESTEKSRLSLNGLAELTDEAALGLSVHRGTLFLNGLKKLSVTAALTMDEHLGLDLRESIFPKKIDAKVAKQFIESPNSVSLENADHITEEAAQHLAEFQGEIRLNGFNYLDSEEALWFAKHQGKLVLNGLEWISVETADALAKHAGDLSLDGLSSLSTTAAEYLATCEGDLSLGGLQEITAKGARALLKKGGIQTAYDLKSHIPNSIDCDTVARFIVDPESVDLTSATTITNEALAALEDYPGNLALNGLENISIEQAIALKKVRGILALDGLTGIDVETAKILAAHQGGYLSLNSLSDLTELAKSTLINYNGLILINGKYWRNSTPLGHSDESEGNPARIVDAFNHGDHATINEALTAANASDRILIRPGLYREGIIIDKPLEIFGDGMIEKIIIEAVGKNAVLFRTDEGKIENLTLRVKGSGNWSGIDITKGILSIVNCDISSQGVSCIAIHNQANPSLRGNRIHNGNGSGVCVYENGLGTLEYNDIFGNVFSGVEIKGGGNPTLRGNRIHDGKAGGVLIFDNGLGTLEDNDIFANAGAGVEIRDSGNPTLRGNRIHDGKQSGVFVNENGLGVLENNQIFANEFSGVAIRKYGNPFLLCNKIYNGIENGVHIYESGLGTFKDNEIYGNAFSGVEIEEGGDPTLKENRIYNNIRFGVSFLANSLGTLEKNKIYENAFSGILIRESANPMLRANQIFGGKQCGAFICKNGRGIIEENAIFNNEMSGVEISEGGNPTLRGNRIYDGKQSGVYVHTNGRGTLEENEIFNNENSGVKIKAGGNPTLKSNRIYHSKVFGVRVESNGMGTFQGNDIFGNLLSNVIITEGSNPTFRGNRIHGSKQCGVLFCENGLGLFEDNDIYGNTFAGVEIREDSDPTLRGNRIHDGMKSGVRVHSNGRGTLEKNFIFANAQNQLEVVSGCNPAQHDNLILHGELASVDSLSSTVARAILESDGDEFVFGNLKSLSSKAADVLSQSSASLVFSSLESITVEAAEALIPHAGSLSLPCITEIPPNVSRVLAQHKGPLHLSNLRKLSIEDAQAFSERAESLNFSRVTRLDLDVARYLVSHRGGIDLSGLKCLSLELAETLSEYVGDLNLSGITDISDHAARHLAKHEGALRLNGLTSLSDAAAEFLFQHSGPLFLDGILTLTAAARESFDARKGYVSLGGKTDSKKLEDLTDEEQTAILGYSAQFLSEGEDFFIPGAPDPLDEAQQDCFSRDSSNGSYFETRVAGVTFENRVVAIRTLAIDDSVILRRQPDNAYDSNAIQVLTTDFRDLGYIPRDLALMVAGSIDFAGGKIFGKVVSVQKGDPPANQLSLFVSFQIDPNPGSGDKQVVQPVVSNDPSQIVSGQLFADKDGRFFIMNLKDSYASVRYENGLEKRHHEADLRNLAAFWPHATLRTISEIKRRLHEHGLEASDDPFRDHDQLAVVERHENTLWQKVAIKYAKEDRRKLLEARHLIPKVKDISDFDFGIPPKQVSYSIEQIKSAADKITHVAKICGKASVLIPYGIIVFFFVQANEFKSFGDFVTRAFLLTILVVFLGFLLFFVTFPLLGSLRDILVKIAQRNWLSQELEIQNRCCSYLEDLEAFLLQERKRFWGWKNSIVEARKEYKRKFVEYIALRAFSPWSIDMRKISAALEKHYPNEIPIRVSHIEAWKRSIWESCHGNSDSSHLKAFCKKLFSETNIRNKPEMIYLK